MAYSSNQSGMFTLSEFRNRGVIKMAPDVLVYINGNLTEQVIVPVDGKGGQKMSFNDGITSVNVQNTIDSPGVSSATINIVTPIYGEHSKYWIPFMADGRTFRVPIFVPMMEVKIFFKGRFLVDGKPRYYPAFWGFITQVDENFSGGAWTISLQCADMLHWWEYSQINVHPVPESNIAAGGGQTMTGYSTIFTNANPYTIIYRLSQSMNMHEFVTATWVGQKTGLAQQYPAELFKSVATGIMTYWQNRFKVIGSGSLLKMYGMTGKPVNDKGITFLEPGTLPESPSSGSAQKQASENTNITQKELTKYDVDNDFIDNNYLQGFTVFFEFSKMGTFNEADYMSKLDIVTEIKNRCGFEFFQDVNGNWIFKPPFYNLNTKYVPSYRIEPADVINSSFQTNAEEIVTVLSVRLPFHPQLRSGARGD